MVVLKRINKMGIKGYRDHNAKIMKAYRSKNKDKFDKIYEKNKANALYRLQDYKEVARNDGKSWELDDNAALSMINGTCFYCNVHTSSELINGIDRLDSFFDYTIDNCVSCCTMCNIMKGSVDSYIFIKRMEHILTNLNYLNGNMDFELFYNYRATSYKQYKRRAEKKNILFELTEYQFNEFKSKPCYLCGRWNDYDHTNGLDRVDNSDGYHKNNVRSCCGECNYMKNNFDVVCFLDKIVYIYNNHKGNKKLIEKLGVDLYNFKKQHYKSENICKKNITKNTRNKLSKNDKVKLQKLREEKRNENMRNTILNEQYREIHSKELGKKKNRNRVDNYNDNEKCNIFYNNKNHYNKNCDEQKDKFIKNRKYKKRINRKRKK